MRQLVKHSYTHTHSADVRTDMHSTKGSGQMRMRDQLEWCVPHAHSNADNWRAFVLVSDMIAWY